MPIQFDNMTPVLDFQAVLPKDAKHNRWILWPTLAYKVSLPQRRPSPLNPFQLAVLRLCQAGMRTPAQIEARLALPQELIALVLDQLRARRLVDGAHGPTEAGLQLLAGEDAPEPVAEAGYVLVDAYSKALWPYLHRGSLPFVDVESTDTPDRVSFIHGTIGRGRSVNARFIKPTDAVEPVRLSARELQRAAVRHARRLRTFAAERGDAMASRAAQALAPGQRVTLLGTAPEPVYVAACLYHQSESAQQAFLVTDPCGFGDGRQLRENIARMAREENSVLGGILRKLSGDAWHVDEAELAYIVQQGRQLAMQRVRRHCGDAVDLLPPLVLQRLADADRRLEDVQRAGAAATRKIEDFVGVVYEALENLFGWLVQMYADPALLKALHPDARPNVALLEGLAAGIGLEVPEEAAFLLAVKRSAVKGAIFDGTRKLQPCLAACLLAASKERRHPLRVLAARQPQALAFLARLNRARNAGSHDGTALPTLVEAQALNEELYALLRGLFGASAEQASAAEQELQQFTDVALRIRARAEQDAASCLGIESHPDIFVRLVDVHEAAIHARTLAAREDAAPLVADSVRDLAVRACIVLETGMRALEHGVQPGKLITGITYYDRHANAALAVSAAQSIGFALDQHGGLPQVLTHADPTRILAARPGTTLSSRVLALLLAAPGPADPLRLLAQENPGWLVDVARVVEVRGHGDMVGLDASHVEPLQSMTVRAVQTVLDVLN